jgi:UDP-N-acetylmuramate dehydrogenase
MTKYKDHVLVKAGAGVVIQNLIDYCLDNNLIGLEEFSHIPGTVGGSAYINIHYFKSFLSDFLETATIIEKQTSNIKTVSKDWFQFGYDTSTLHNKKQYILNATFKLKRANHIKTAYCKGKRDEIIRQRSARYPKTRTCGCFFRNFLEQEIPCTMNNKKIPYTAYYLDKLGIKGDLRFGNAIVSSKHANMIETLPGATSRDVINLAKQMQTLVLEKYGIIPQPECQLIGFKTYPLITV